MRKGEIQAGVGTGAVGGSLGDERNESVKSKYRVRQLCLNETPLGSVNKTMQSAKLPQVTEFKYLGTTLQSVGDMSTELSKQEDTVWMEQLEEDVKRPVRYDSTTTGTIHKIIVQPAML